MSQPHDDYKRLEFVAGQHVEPCPVCGADMELWQYSVSETSPTNKVVMCSNGEPFGPQDGIAGGCPLYMPPNAHYKATAREAVRFWNEFAKALMEQQRVRRWARTKARGGVTRKGSVAEGDSTRSEGRAQEQGADSTGAALKQQEQTR